MSGNSGMNLISLYVIDEYLLTRIAHKKYFSNDSEFELLGDFSTAEECLINMEKRPSDIVITDIELPEMNGIEATKLIKEKFPKTKVIINTSHRNEQRILASLAVGASGYVLKNDRSADLKKIIKMVMHGEFWMDLEVAHLAFSTIPTPNIKDLENLYENKKLKNMLTKRELEVLKLLIDGKTNSQIASEIIVSTNTAKAHVGSIFAKLAVTDSSLL